jgi:eukaryotic-like serine/threonine-protein kinase
VLDFGVSKALSQDVRAEGTVTTTDAVFGSPLYMSPEQMQSASKADERSDIWSLGVLLYELVSHKMPFDAESMAGLAVRIATDPPTRLINVLPTAPLELEGVIFKCLEKDPNKRYANIAELAADLEPFAPACRPQVERIQRLVFGSTNPPLVAPSAPSLRRLVAHGAETLGPLDAETSSPAVVVTERKRRTWPFAVAVMATAGIVAATTVALRNFSSASSAPVSGMSPPAPTVPVSAAPLSSSASSAVVTALTAAVVDTVEPLTTAAPSTAVAASTQKQPHIPIHSNRDVVSSGSGSGGVGHMPTAPSATISGISRDRK